MCDLRDCAVTGGAWWFLNPKSQIHTTKESLGNLIHSILWWSDFWLNALGEVYMLLYTSRLAARLPARIAALGKICRVFITVALFHFFLRTRWIPKQQGASACCPLHALHPPPGSLWPIR